MQSAGCPDRRPRWSALRHNLLWRFRNNMRRPQRWVWHSISVDAASRSAGQLDGNGDTRLPGVRWDPWRWGLSGCERCLGPQRGSLWHHSVWRKRHWWRLHILWRRTLRHSIRVDAAEGTGRRLEGEHPLHFRRSVGSYGEFDFESQRVLYGTTWDGGTYGKGTIFSIGP